MPDFSKIWATNSPLPEFNFTDEEYLEGWDFVDAAPPTKNQFDAWFRETDKKLKWLYDKVQSTAAQIYPVGAVYISFNSTSPDTLFGGTWTRLKDRILMASGDVYAANSTGGNATVTLNTNQIPSHNHSISTDGLHAHTATNSSAGTHNHTVSGTVASNGSHTHTWSGSATNAGNHSHTWSGSATSAGNHTHTWSGTSASAGSHTHTISGDTGEAGSHTHSITISSKSLVGKFSAVARPTFKINPSGIASATLANSQIASGDSDPDWRQDLTIDASHNHTASASTVANHKHGFSAVTSNAGNHTHTLTGSNASAGAHTHTISGTNANNGTHTHTLSGNNANNGAHTHTWSGSIANNGAHTHTITVANNGAHTHTIGNTGGGLPINILPPYQTVYMWRRTA